LGDWSVDNGTWEVGVPSSGPRAAHSGGQCAATVLAGNYGENVTTRLVSPAFEVPAANQSPRLRFWHWFSFGAGDLGTVQFKDGPRGGVNLSGSYGPHSSGVWSRPSLDLSAYAGRRVQLSFLFQSVDAICCGNDDTGPGWYIDEVAVVTGAAALANPEDFELGLGDWSVDNGTWEVGVPSSGPRAAHSGGQCAATVLAGDYG